MHDKINCNRRHKTSCPEYTVTLIYYFFSAGEDEIPKSVHAHREEENTSVCVHVCSSCLAGSHRMHTAHVYLGQQTVPEQLGLVNRLTQSAEKGY